MSDGGYTGVNTNTQRSLAAGDREAYELVVQKRKEVQDAMDNVKMQGGNVTELAEKLATYDDAFTGMENHTAEQAEFNERKAQEAENMRDDLISTYK